MGFSARCSPSIQQVDDAVLFARSRVANLGGDGLIFFSGGVIETGSETYNVCSLLQVASTRFDEELSLEEDPGSFHSFQALQATSAFGQPRPTGMLHAVRCAMLCDIISVL